MINKRFVFFSVILAFMFFLFLTGCTNGRESTHQNEFKSIVPVGQIPDEFKETIKSNRFQNITAFDKRLLKVERLQTDIAPRTVTHRIRMMDLYGRDLAVYECHSDDAYHASTLTVTEDGGFLFVLGFSDYAYDSNTWASAKGFASRIIKCDSHGNVQFDTPLDGITGWALRYCFEKNEQFYFFGDIETPETNKTGVQSPTDICLTILDNNGTLLKSRRIAGSDYDSLDAAEISNGSFVLSVSAQSKDGDFSGSNSNGFPVDWVIAVDDNLEITEKKIESGRSSLDERLGEKAGSPVYKSSPLLNGFDAGSPTSFIDYGNFYLIVSENITGKYENTPPTVSSIWYYTETVYTAYDENHKILFRTSIDSSPDYDALVKESLSQ